VFNALLDLESDHFSITDIDAESSLSENSAGSEDNICYAVENLILL
jgi:hypothetical protein